MYHYFHCKIFDLKYYCTTTRDENQFMGHFVKSKQCHIIFFCLF